MAVPVLDTSLYTSGSLAQRAQFADALVKSCIQHGFVKLVNHGVPEQMVEELFKYGREFFKISTEAKQKIQNPPGPDPQRGWSCIGAERSAKLYRTGIGEEDTKAKLSDAREHFDQGSPADIAFPNRWPDEVDLPGFRTFMESYYLALEKVGFKILQALELGLKVPPGSFTNKCLGGASEVRINHYPEIDLKELKNGDVSRIWPHTDLGVITCLFQDDNGGLEMQDRVKCDGSFVPIPRESPSEMVINISETFQRWTNGIVKAGVHQVTIPPHMKNLQEGVIPTRFSNAYFMKADRHANVGPIEQFVSEKHPSEYDSITALQYHQQRLATAYV